MRTFFSFAHHCIVIFFFVISFCIGIGKNVISEQAATLMDAYMMVTAARYYPQLMSIMGNSLRFLPAFVQMKRMLGEGYCGNLQVCHF